MDKKKIKEYIEELNKAGIIATYMYSNKNDWIEIMGNTTEKSSKRFFGNIQVEKILSFTNKQGLKFWIRENPLRIIIVGKKKKGRNK